MRFKIEHLFQDDPDEIDGWISVKKRLPDKNTLYASKYGVPVICFDLREIKDSGYCIPTEVDFHFKEKWFMQLATSAGKTIWIPADVTHWREIPPVPVKMKLPKI